MILARKSWPIVTMLALALTGCANPPPPLPAPVAHPNGEVLWRIVHDRCVPDQREHGSPAPCTIVDLTGGEARGYVVFKDRNGVAQYLLMPTARITGVEDPALLAPGAVNYFALAWMARHQVDARLGRRLDPTQVMVAVNSQFGRSQDQLHLHIDCADASVADALRRIDPPAARWTTVKLKGRDYRVRWLDEDQIERVNVFALLAHTLPGASRAMGAWTLALTGAATPAGRRGFWLLADRADPARGDFGSSEELQDHTCRP